MSENTEKTISLDSARLFRVRTVLAELKAGVRLSLLNPVEVRSGDRRLGWASLSLESNSNGTRDRLVADMVFSYSTPERLSIETRSQALYGRLEAVNTLAEEPFETVGLYHADLPVTEIEVLGLEISHTPGFEGQPALGEGVL